MEEEEEEEEEEEGTEGRKVNTLDMVGGHRVYTVQWTQGESMDFQTVPLYMAYPGISRDILGCPQHL